MPLDDLLDTIKEGDSSITSERPGRAMMVFIASDQRYNLALLARYSGVTPEVLASHLLNAAVKKASLLLEGLH